MDKKLEKKFMTAPFAKIEKTKDGGREVWGFTTLERVDKAGEIADFEGTVKAFGVWSDEVSKRTGGKNLGNVRVMHQAIPAGKTIHWEPSERTITDEEGKEQTYKGIYVGAYIPPTKPDVIKDVDEGILSAFSIGGDYEKRWYDATAKAFRYIPTLAEYSLVDNPCVNGADIINVIAKADGPWNKDYSKFEKGDNEVENELKKEAEGSYEDLRNDLRDAVNEKYNIVGDNDCCCCSSGFYVAATYPDKVIVCFYNTGKYMSIPYTYDEAKEDEITLGEPTEVEYVENYVPKKTIKFIEAEMQKATKTKVKNAKKTPPEGYPENKDEYGDPDNYKYPIDETHIKSAVSYFNHEGEKGKGGYTDKQWDKIGGRIADAANKLIGKGHSYKDGKIELEKEEAKKLNEDELKKAAETAGLDFEKLKVFFDSLNLGKSMKDDKKMEDDKEMMDDKEEEKETAKEKKEEDNKENKDVGKATKEAEKVYLDELKKSIDDLVKDSNKLEKVNVPISKERMAHLQHAKNHITAAVDGTDYKDNLEISPEGGKGNNGEEAPAVTVKAEFGELKKNIEGANENLTKAFDDKLNKSFNKIEALFKNVPSADEVKKLNEKLESMEKMVKEIHETPQLSPVILNGGSSLTKGIGQSEDDVLEKFMKSTNDVFLKDKIGQELALRALKGGK